MSRGATVYQTMYQAKIVYSAVKKRDQSLTAGYGLYIHEVVSHHVWWLATRVLSSRRLMSSSLWFDGACRQLDLTTYEHGSEGVTGTASQVLELKQ